MTRAQTLGLMAAEIWKDCALVSDDSGLQKTTLNERAGIAVAIADALLREAERVSPEAVSIPSVFLPDMHPETTTTYYPDPGHTSEPTA